MTESTKKTGNNKPRQLGRWNDKTWDKLRKAAASSDMSVAAWARPILLRAAKRLQRADE